jgi:uncharacterized protein (DUF885 family)
LADIESSLAGLPIDVFFDESYKQLLLRFPEYLTLIGMAEAFGQHHDRLDDLSEAYIRETQELELTILDLLRTYDRATLDPEQQISYDIYEWYLDTEVRGHQFMYNNYPLHHLFSSWHDRLIRLFTVWQPLDDRLDAQAYISRLSQVDEQAAQLLDGLKRREKAGVILPQFIISRVIPDLQEIAESDAKSTPFYSAFDRKLETIDGLSEGERQQLLEAAGQEIEESVLPAFQSLAEYLEYLDTVATSDAGVWKFPDGKDYYVYRLWSQTSIDITPEEVHQLGLAEVERIRAELRHAFEDLGYPRDANFGRLMERARQEAGSYDARSKADKAGVIEAYELLINRADEAADAVFDIRPAAELIVVGDPAGGYYASGPLDGSRPGIFYATTGGSTVAKFNMPTITYHETIPGHHLQISVAQQQNIPLFRKDLFVNSYAEGWALYAERLAWELGLYEDDPYGNLGRLQMELLRAVRMVVDTGIHAEGWTRSEARGYMRRTLGDRTGHWSHEVERYIVLPAQATGYTIGLLKILELRQYAMDELGDRFDIKEFHRVILAGGGMPLDILEKRVYDYVDSK